MMRQKGFTLIELSIVLVIIGLIIGGVLVGRDLIRAAEVRSAVKQIEQFSTAVNAFRLKYNCLPGDCAQAMSFGLTSYSGDPNVVDGNGDGIINSYEAETFTVPVHLLQAGLLAEKLSNLSGIDAVIPKLRAVDAGGVQGAIVLGYMEVSDDPITYPSLNRVAAHYYWYNALRPGGGSTNVLTPLDAYAMDNKIDDGLPLTGTVLGSSSMGGSYYNTSSSFIALHDPASDEGAAGATSNFCVTNDSPQRYNVLNLNRGSQSLCTLMIKAPI